MQQLLFRRGIDYFCGSSSEYRRCNESSEWKGIQLVQGIAGQPTLNHPDKTCFSKSNACNGTCIPGYIYCIRSWGIWECLDETQFVKAGDLCKKSDSWQSCNGTFLSRNVMCNGECPEGTRKCGNECVESTSSQIECNGRCQSPFEICNGDCSEVTITIIFSSLGVSRPAGGPIRWQSYRSLQCSGGKARSRK